MKIFILFLILFAQSVFAADTIDVNKFQPAIISDQAPTEVRGMNVQRWIRRTYLQPFNPIVPSYDKSGMLLASWNPQYEKAGKATFIVMHGGHGPSPSDFTRAEWLQITFKANILVLDSYWSRGQQENFATYTKFGVNMRVLDAIAAGRFVKSQGVDLSRIFLLGSSQGGWTVLRTFTMHDKTNEVVDIFKGGIALYPNCVVRSRFFSYDPFAPKLGPDYSRQVIMFTGGKDDATPVKDCSKQVTQNLKYHHYDEGTHAWDVPLSDNNACTRAHNIYNRFPMCRNDVIHEAVNSQIINFIKENLP